MGSTGSCGANLTTATTGVHDPRLHPYGRSPNPAYRGRITSDEALMTLTDVHTGRRRRIPWRLPGSRYTTVVSGAWAHDIAPVRFDCCTTSAGPGARRGQTGALNASDPTAFTSRNLASRNVEGTRSSAHGTAGNGTARAKHLIPYRRSAASRTAPEDCRCATGTGAVVCTTSRRAAEMGTARAKDLETQRIAGAGGTHSWRIKRIKDGEETGSMQST